MPKLHELKTWPEYYNLVASGAKTFEVRRDDRDFQPGDTVLLQEWDPQEHQYTGHQIRATVGYVLRGDAARWAGLRKGYCVFSLSLRGGA
jgi:hypothetical protein